jgi:hypothetical protein
LSSKAVKELSSLQFVSVVKILLSICKMQNPAAREAHQPTCGWDRTSRAIWAVSKQKNMKRARIRSEPKKRSTGSVHAARCWPNQNQTMIPDRLSVCSFQGAPRNHATDAGAGGLHG